MRRLTVRTLPDPSLEAVRQDHAAAIHELQALPAVSIRIVTNVSLADGVETPVAHGLGRPPQWVRESCPRSPSTSGRVEEVRTGSGDRRKFVVLKATGWGATITVDVMVA